MEFGAQRDESRWPAGSLRATSISRSFDGVLALDGVTIDLARHEVVGLIGPNGAGKTTLVNVMSGFDRPDIGSVHLGEEDITDWPPHRRGRRGLARTFQGAHSFTGLSVRENVEVSALGVGARPAEARDRADELLQLLGLMELQLVPAAVLSHGHERRLGVARALATEPAYVLMDEPAAGLNDVEVADFAEAVRTVRDEHDVGFLLIDHNLSLVLEICDRIHVLDQGRTIAEGSPIEIRESVVVAAAYLGSRGATGEGQ